MFGLSFGEIVIIAVLALLLLGPDKLPDAAKTLAKGLKELRRASDELKDQIGSELGAIEDAKRTMTGALAGAVADATRDERPAREGAAPSDEPRAPPVEAAAANVPGLEAALVEPGAPPAPPAPQAAKDEAK